MTETLPIVLMAATGDGIRIGIGGLFELLRVLADLVHKTSRLRTRCNFQPAACTRRGRQ